MATDTFAELDPHYYLRLTSVTEEQYRWTEAEPGREEAVMLDRPFWSSDWGSSPRHSAVAGSGLGCLT